METLTGGRLVARMLRKEGVTTAFTLSGLHVAPIYAGCVDEGIRLVDTRHEQAAAHAADAWARLTRGVGVAIVTAGPGVTDAVTGVANAWAANVPLVLLGGAAPTFNQGRGSLQEMPQTQLFAGITKWSDRVPSAELVPSYLAKAFRVARAGRPGPVFLELPWDVLSNGADEALADAQTQLPHRRALAGRPAQGGGGARAARRAPSGRCCWAARRSGGTTRVEALARLATRTGIPVYLNGMGRGCLPPDHPSASCSSRARRRSRRPTWCSWWARRSTSAWATAPSPPSPRARASSRWTWTARRSAGTGRSTWASSATRASVLEQLEAGARLSPAAAAWRSFLRDEETARAERQRALRGERPAAHPPLPARQGARRGGRARRRRDLRRRRRQRRGGGGEGAPGAAARALARPRPARLPRRRRAVRDRREAPRPGAAGVRHPGRRRVRPERLRLRDRGALRAADGGRGRQRRGLGADPRPAARPLRRRPRRRRRGSRPPATTGSSRRSAARGSTSTIPPTSSPPSSGRSRRGRSTAWTSPSTRRRRRRAGRRGTLSSRLVLGSGPPRRGGSPRR